MFKFCEFVFNTKINFKNILKYCLFFIKRKATCLQALPIIFHPFIVHVLCVWLTLQQSRVCVILIYKRPTFVGQWECDFVTMECQMSKKDTVIGGISENFR